MRPIKFRGKSIIAVKMSSRQEIAKQGDWAYGSLIVDTQPYIVGEIADVDREFITPKFWIPVDKNTIGQFTGLHDKNGVEIYEGDVVKLIDSNNRKLKCNVEYITGSFWYVIQHNQLTIGIWEYHNFGNKSVEVIGNIHEVKE